MKRKKNLFKREKIVASFSVLALISGFLFINKGITGNVILSNKYSFNLVSIIGLALIACSIILGIYLVKQKD